MFNTCAADYTNYTDMCIVCRVVWVEIEAMMVISVTMFQLPSLCEHAVFIKTQGFQVWATPFIIVKQTHWNGVGNVISALFLRYWIRGQTVVTIVGFNDGSHMLP